MQRLLVIELLSISCETPQVNEFCWSDELYPGEFDDLSMCNLYSKENHQLVTPRLKDCNSAMHALPVQHNHQPNQEILQVLGSIFILIFFFFWVSEQNKNIRCRKCTWRRGKKSTKTKDKNSQVQELQIL